MLIYLDTYFFGQQLRIHSFHQKHAYFHQCCQLPSIDCLNMIFTFSISFEPMLYLDHKFVLEYLMLYLLCCLFALIRLLLKAQIIFTHIVDWGFITLFYYIPLRRELLPRYSVADHLTNASEHQWIESSRYFMLLHWSIIQHTNLYIVSDFNSQLFALMHVWVYVFLYQESISIL